MPYPGLLIAAGTEQEFAGQRKEGTVAPGVWIGDTGELFNNSLWGLLQVELKKRGGQGQHGRVLPPSLLLCHQPGAIFLLPPFPSFPPLLPYPAPFSLPLPSFRPLLSSPSPRLSSAPEVCSWPSLYFPVSLFFLPPPGNVGTFYPIELSRRFSLFLSLKDMTHLFF